MWHTCIETFKRELAWAIDKQFQFISNSKTVMLLKNKGLKHIATYVVLSNRVICNIVGFHYFISSLLDCGTM